MPPEASRPQALLAIRSDIAAAVERDYLDWLTREHMLERVGIESFLSARLLRSQHPGFGRYLILYELADASVVDSAAYRERLNNPTPWTTRMMPHLGNFVRGGGTVTTVAGAGNGAAVVAVMTGADSCARECEALEAVAQQPGIAAIRVLQTDMDRTSVATSERKLRSGDQSFEALLMLEAFDRGAAKRAAEKLSPNLLNVSEQKSASHEIPVYTQIFSLDAASV